MQIDISQCAFDVWDDGVHESAFYPLGPDLVADLLALPRGPWVRQR